MLGMRLPQLLLGPLRRYPVGDCLAQRRQCVAAGQLEPHWQYQLYLCRPAAVIYHGCGGGGGGGGGHHGGVYIVRCGDTLWSIARMYHTTPWAIANWNGIHNINLIYAGQRLYIP